MSETLRRGHSPLAGLSRRERVFLAGCIKMTILEDGMIEEPELADLDRIYGRLDFEDYEQSLEEFESEVRDRESFAQMAAGITRAAARDLTLKTVHELSLQHSIALDKEESVFRRLRRIWGS